MALAQWCQELSAKSYRSFRNVVLSPSVAKAVGKAPEVSLDRDLHSFSYFSLSSHSSAQAQLFQSIFCCCSKHSRLGNLKRIEVYMAHTSGSCGHRARLSPALLRACLSVGVPTQWRTGHEMATCRKNQAQNLFLLPNNTSPGKRKSVLETRTQPFCSINEMMQLYTSYIM